MNNLQLAISSLTKFINQTCSEGLTKIILPDLSVPVPVPSFVPITVPVPVYLFTRVPVYLCTCNCACVPVPVFLFKYLYLKPTYPMSSNQNLSPRIVLGTGRVGSLSNAFSIEKKILLMRN